MKSRKKSLIIILLTVVSVIFIGCDDKGQNAVTQENLAIKEDLVKMKNEILKYKEQISRLEEELKVYKDYNESCLKRIDEFHNKNKELKNENNKLNTEISWLKTQLYEGNRRIKQLNKYRFIIQQHKQQIESLIEPKYLLNIFDPFTIKKGESIAHLTVEDKDIEAFEYIDTCIHEDVRFKGKYKLKGKIYKNEDSGGVVILVDKSQITNIPLHINYIDADSIQITILNGNEFIDSLGDEYYDGIEITGFFSGLRYHSKIEAEKMIDTTFIKLISINN
jgi:hypothetical protein